MAQLIVRNIEDSLVRRLKKRAGEHGVSMEEEHRRILREALARQFEENGAKSFWQMLTEMPNVGEDALFARDRTLEGRGSKQNFFDD